MINNLDLRVGDFVYDAGVDKISIQRVNSIIGRHSVVFDDRTEAFCKNVVPIPLGYKEVLKKFGFIEHNRLEGIFVYETDWLKIEIHIYNNSVLSCFVFKMKNGEIKQCEQASVGFMHELQHKVYDIFEKEIEFEL